MYPNLYYAFRDLFGVDWKALRFVNSFGFFVAIAFLAAAYVLTIELKRKQRSGLLQGTDVKIVVGKPASFSELLLNFVLGFLLGFKIVGLFTGGGASYPDPQSFIFSSSGNWPAGILLGIVFAVIKWLEKNKRKLAKPEERTIRIWPHDRVGDLVIYAALFGFAGAKIFHNLENWDDFVANPVEALLSFSGLTFYGGLICATAAIGWYARKHKIGFRHLCDAAAPALMLAYALGRIGCMTAGDGDWGILNSAYITGENSKAQLASPQEFQQRLADYKTVYFYEFKIDTISKVPHTSFKAPSWMPVWMVAFPFPHNVIGQGMPIPGCTDGQYCEQLPVPVFPTPFYETIMGIGLFIFLWSIRKKLAIPGTMFAVYLIVNGVERFLIELIRVNTKYNIFGFRPTQAELISSALVITGALLFWYLRKRQLSPSKS